MIDTTWARVWVTTRVINEIDIDTHAAYVGGSSADSIRPRSRSGHPFPVPIVIVRRCSPRLHLLFPTRLPRYITRTRLFPPMCATKSMHDARGASVCTRKRTCYYCVLFGTVRRSGRLRKRVGDTHAKALEPCTFVDLVERPKRSCSISIRRPSACTPPCPRKSRKSVEKGRKRELRA